MLGRLVMDLIVMITLQFFRVFDKFLVTSQTVEYRRVYFQILSQTEITITILRNSFEKLMH